MAAVAFIVCRTASIKNSARIVRPRRERAHLRDSPLVLRRAAVPHDLGNRVDRPPAGHRIAIPGALPFNQIMRCRIKIGPTSTSFGVICLVAVRKFGLNDMDQQRKKPRRIFGVSRATADLMNPIRSDQLQHDTPLHPDLPATMTGRSHSAPTFWTGSAAAHGRKGGRCKAAANSFCFRVQISNAVLTSPALVPLRLQCPRPDRLDLGQHKPSGVAMVSSATEILGQSDDCRARVTSTYPM